MLLYVDVDMEFLRLDEVEDFIFLQQSGAN